MHVRVACLTLCVYNTVFMVDRSAERKSHREVAFSFPVTGNLVTTYYTFWSG